MISHDLSSEKQKSSKEKKRKEKKGNENKRKEKKERNIVSSIHRVLNFVNKYFYYYHNATLYIAFIFATKIIALNLSTDIKTDSGM